MNYWTKFLRLVYVFNLIVIACFLNSCLNDNSDFESDIKVSGITYYPNDSITVQFFVDLQKGIQPIQLDWNNPDSLSGTGPFTINLISDLLLDVNVSDAGSMSRHLTYYIKKDTIDSLKYDYRNYCLATYVGEASHSWIYTDSNGVPQTYNEVHFDSLTVNRGNDIYTLNIPSYPTLYFDFKDSTFYGYHTQGKFRSDSVFINYQPGLGPSWYGFKGVKVQ